MGFIEDLGRGVAAVATCGLSEVAIRASEAMDTVSNTGEAVGVTVGAIGDTAQKLGNSVTDLLTDIDHELILKSDGTPGEVTKTISTVNQTLSDFDDLLTIQRATPRSDPELWPEEKLRIKAIDAELQTTSTQISALEKQKKQLVDILKGLEFPDHSWASFTLFGEDAEDQIDKLTFDSKDDVGKCLIICFSHNYSDMETVATTCQTLANVIDQLQNMCGYEGNLYRERDHILYTEPGVIPCILDSVNDILARFNSIEQPMLEDILDSVDDGVEETVGILKQVRGLFVETKLVPRDLPEIDTAHRDWLLSKKTTMKAMAIKEYNLSNKLFTTIAPMTPNLTVIKEEN